MYAFRYVVYIFFGMYDYKNRKIVTNNNEKSTITSLFLQKVSFYSTIYQLVF